MLPAGGGRPRRARSGRRCPAPRRRPAAPPTLSSWRTVTKASSPLRPRLTATSGQGRPAGQLGADRDRPVLAVAAAREHPAPVRDRRQEVPVRGMAVRAELGLRGVVEQGEPVPQRRQRVARPQRRRSGVEQGGERGRGPGVDPARAVHGAGRPPVEGLGQQTGGRNRWRMTTRQDARRPEGVPRRLRRSSVGRRSRYYSSRPLRRRPGAQGPRRGRGADLRFDGRAVRSRQPAGPLPPPAAAHGCSCTASRTLSAVLPAGPLAGHGVELAEIAHTGHFPMYSNPTEMWSRITSFALCTPLSAT